MRERAVLGIDSAAEARVRRSHGRRRPRDRSRDVAVLHRRRGGYPQLAHGSCSGRRTGAEIRAADWPRDIAAPTSGRGAAIEHGQQLCGTGPKLEDKEAIHALFMKYGRCLDTKDWDLFVTLFAEETARARVNGGVGAARARCTLVKDVPPAFHVFANESLKIDSARDRVLAVYVSGRQRLAALPAVRVEDSLTRESGEWLFQKHLITRDLGFPPYPEVIAGARWRTNCCSGPVASTQSHAEPADRRSDGAQRGEPGRQPRPDLRGLPRRAAQLIRRWINVRRRARHGRSVPGPLPTAITSFPACERRPTRCTPRAASSRSTVFRRARRSMPRRRQFTGGVGLHDPCRRCAR